MAKTVLRPLWKAFPPARAAAARTHALAGGLAVVQAERWTLLGADGDPLPLFVEWALCAVEAGRWSEDRGVVAHVIRRDWQRRVGDWLDRDAHFAGAAAPFRHDCTRCAACCIDNMVLLGERDRARLRASGKPALIAQARLHKLPLLRGADRACVHLDGFRCGIYPHRPDMCREFPAGSEQCLTSREEMFGVPFLDDR